MSKKKHVKKQKKDGKPIAETVDRYTLYLASVQEPEAEVRFFPKAYRQAYGKDTNPTILREDFCGTAAICYEWTKKKDRHAIGVDIDPEPLAWGKDHLTADLPSQQLERVKLVHGDVRRVHETKADIVAAQNFSFWYFKTRDEVRKYFEIVRQNLKDQGVVVLDMMGGPESITEDLEDVREVETDDGFKFEYVWEQERFDPVTHDCRYHISFRFKDKSEWYRAFTYEWRFWSIPEVRELLKEAGFKHSVVYWEQSDEDGEGNGIYKPVDSAAHDPSWVTYVVGVK